MVPWWQLGLAHEAMVVAMAATPSLLMSKGPYQAWDNLPTRSTKSHRMNQDVLAAGGEPHVEGKPDSKPGWAGWSRGLGKGPVDTVCVPPRALQGLMWPRRPQTSS